MVVLRLELRERIDLRPVVFADDVFTADVFAIGTVSVIFGTIYPD